MARSDGHDGPPQDLGHHPRRYPEIKYKKPHFQYNLYQECGFLCLISHCTCRRYTLPCAIGLRRRYGFRGTEGA
eukprot:3897779-Rhodomonas_salina.2